MSNVMEIRSRWDNKVLFSVEADTLKEAVLSAIKAGADLYGADLRSADLRSANLGGARNLPQNALAPYRDDIRQILGSSPTEVGGLLQALRDGKVDGSTYTGECACLVGTIAKVRGVSYDAIPGLRPDSSRPAEQWFTNIRKGDTPVNNPAAAFACAVIVEWMHERSVAELRKRALDARCDAIRLRSKLSLLLGAVQLYLEDEDEDRVESYNRLEKYARELDDPRTATPERP